MTKCAREGCKKAAVSDEFCSAVCAKIYYGTLSEDDLRQMRNERRKVENKRAREDGYARVDNPHHNIDRHEGPQIAARKSVRRTSGSR